MYTAATATDFNQRVDLGNSYCNCFHLMCRVEKTYLVNARLVESKNRAQLSRYTVLKYWEFVKFSSMVVSVPRYVDFFPVYVVLILFVVITQHAYLFVCINIPLF